MNPSATILHQEIKKIANMQSLIQTRMVLLFSTFLIMFYYFAYHYALYSLYVFFFTLFAPSILEFAFNNANFSDKKQLLPTLKHIYHFQIKRYYCFYITFWFSNILLACWQFNIYSHPTNQLPANIFPSILLFGNVLFYVCSTYYYRFKFHYQLLNNQW